MRIATRILSLSFVLNGVATCSPLTPSSRESQHHFDSFSVFGLDSSNSNVSVELFAELEEFSRIVDIAYCVGVTGIRAPFECASRCNEFPEYQLVDTWNTGPLMSDSCGYIVLDHNAPGRIILAFRGTYSVANTIVDLSTVPQEYVPYPGDPEEDKHDDDDSEHHSFLGRLRRPWTWFGHGRRSRSASASTKTDGNGADGEDPKGPRCNNCTVHMGFLSSWKNTRPLVLPHVTRLVEEYPDYSLQLVGHSLGGAVAALASLEFEVLGWNPTVTTFGEPRIGNKGLRTYLDALFGLESSNNGTKTARSTKVPRYRRVTHVDDPVPLLPLTEWGYLMHSGEIYISKPALSPAVDDLHFCHGDEDINCIAGQDDSTAASLATVKPGDLQSLLEAFSHNSDVDLEGIDGEDDEREMARMRKRWGLPARYKMWQLFFAHRDYFWRLGLCVPGGDPFDWGREKYGDGSRNDDESGREL